MSTSVSLTALSIGYNTRQGVRTVAKGISADIFDCQLTCLLGDNGSGKSTLLRTLAGFQPPLAGSIVVHGRPLPGYSGRELATTIGVVLTDKPDVRQMTARELVAMGRAPYTGFWGRLSAADREATDQAIALVGIEQLAGRMVSTLSDGERQKVMIAKTLAQQTPVILLDEPTAFLDYHSKADILLLLKRIASDGGKTVFLSTHDLELALQVADTLWIMDAAEGLKTGTTASLAGTGLLKRFIERNGSLAFNEDTMSILIRDRH